MDPLAVGPFATPIFWQNGQVVLVESTTICKDQERFYIISAIELKSNHWTCQLMKHTPSILQGLIGIQITQIRIVLVNLYRYGVKSLTVLGLLVLCQFKE